MARTHRTKTTRRRKSTHKRRKSNKTRKNNNVKHTKGGGFSLKRLFTRKKKTPCEANLQKLRSMRRRASTYTQENGFNRNSVAYNNKIRQLIRLTADC